MRIALCLSGRVSRDIVESARAFNLTLDEILSGPALVAEMFGAIARTGGHIAIRQPHPEGFLVREVPILAIEEFRRKPGVRAFESSVGDLGGVQLEGTTLEVRCPNVELKEIQGALKAASLLEAYSYGLWLYLALLRTARDYPGAGFGVYAPRENRFYGCEAQHLSQRRGL